MTEATPKELNKAHKLIQQQLNGIQHGSAAWDTHVAKIRAVKAELQKVNAILATQKSMWSRMNTWLNNAQTAMMAFAATLDTLGQKEEMSATALKKPATVTSQRRQIAQRCRTHHKFDSVPVGNHKHSFFRDRLWKRPPPLAIIYG